MKKIYAVLAIVLIAVLGVGIIIGAKNCNKSDSAFENEMTLLSEEYVVGEKIYFKYAVFSDVKLVSINYEINNGVEQPVTITPAAETSSLENGREDYGKAYYVESKVVEVSTENLCTGWYTLSFYGYDGAGNRYELTERPYSFKLVSQA